MEVIVVDASVVLKWVLEKNEQNAAEARGLLKKVLAGEVRALVPEVVMGEIINVMMWKKDFGIEEILEFVDFLENQVLVIVGNEKFEWKSLMEIMKKYNLAIYDAYYVLLAEKERCKVVSVDKKMIKVKDWCRGL